MTRPDWCDEATWAAASAFVRKDVRVQNDELRAIVAEAMMSARAVQREEDARIAEKGEWRIKTIGGQPIPGATASEAQWVGPTAFEIAAAIRNGGK